MNVNTNLLKGEIVARGLTQEKVADAVGVDVSTMSRYLNGDSIKISIGTIHKIANVLKLDQERAADIFLSN